MAIAPNGTPAGQQAAPQQQQRPMEKMAARIMGMKNELAMAMPKDMNVNRIIRIMVNCVNDNPKLLQCTENSFLGCLFKSAQYGLEPNTGDGYAYLIPYGDVCTFQIGYLGILKLARNTGRYAHIDAIGVFKGEKFAYSEGFSKDLQHLPNLDENGAPIRPGEPHTFYALYKMHDGNKDFKVWTRAECLAHGRKYSKTFNKGPWQDHQDRMCKKTVLIDLFKYADKSVEVMKQLADAARSDFGSVRLKHEPGKPVELSTSFDHIQQQTIEIGSSETMAALASAELDAAEAVRLDLVAKAEARFDEALARMNDMIAVQNKIGMSKEQLKDCESKQLTAIIQVLGKA